MAAVIAGSRLITATSGFSMFLALMLTGVGAGAMGGLILGIIRRARHPRGSE